MKNGRVMGDGTEITEFTVDIFNFWLEPKMVFIDGTKVGFFDVTMGGGFFIYSIDSDGDERVVVRYNENHPLAIEFQREYFEAKVLAN